MSLACPLQDDQEFLLSQHFWELCICFWDTLVFVLKFWLSASLQWLGFWSHLLITLQELFYFFWCTRHTLGRTSTLSILELTDPQILHLTFCWISTRAYWEQRLCCCSSVSQSCPTLCDLMDCSTPGFPVLHYLPEFAQTHVHWVSDAIQPPHPLSAPSPPSLNFSQHQGLFHWVGSTHQEAKVLELQHGSLQWIFRVDFLLELTGLILLSKGLSRVFSNTTIQKHQFFGAQPFLWFNSYKHTYIHRFMSTGKTIALIIQTWDISKTLEMHFNIRAPEMFLTTPWLHMHRF